MTTHEDSGVWLSLREASQQLGVNTSTLRRWGDEGRVPMRKTLGGHRRFQASAVEQLRPKQATAALIAAPHPTWGVDERELVRQQWHAKLAIHGGAERMRGLGQRLLGLLIQYINRRDDDGRFLLEAGEVGRSYGAGARASDISLHSTVEAFLFFRGAFSQLALPIPGIAQPTDLDAAAALHGRIDRFMDAVLLGLIEGYQAGDV